MNCPKCGFPLEADAAECPRCGIVIAKFIRAQEGRAARPSRPASPDETALDVERENAAHETYARAAALPVALLVAWLAVTAAPGLVRLLSMWVHESGHTVAAWLCGYAALPGPWFTPVGVARSPILEVLLNGALAFAGYLAWQRRRWFWLIAAGAVLLLTIACTLLLSPASAQQFIIFAGDGGCFVLGTALMLTVYARETHPVRRNQLRWGFLLLGAIAFVDAYHAWSGPIGTLFGENENGMSDASVLVERYGWPALVLKSRYLELARVCLVVLLVVYSVGVLKWRASHV